MKWNTWIKRLTVLTMAGVMAAAGAVTSLAATRLDTVEDTYWDDDNMTLAIWEEVEDAYRYQVYLYCEESKVAEIKTKNTKYDFEKKMTKAGEYTFRVRALAKESDYKDGYWSEYSDSIYIDEDFAELMKNGGVIDTMTSGPGAKTDGSAPSDEVSVVSSGQWVQDSIGWWYRNPDGSYPMASWWQDPSSGIWYYFDVTGYMATGWIDWNGSRYYCDASGAMLTGTHVIDGVSCQFDASGALQ